MLVLVAGNLLPGLRATIGKPVAHQWQVTTRAPDRADTMDLGLPGEGGLGAIEQIMADLPPPILVLSARVTGAGKVVQSPR